MRRVFEPKLLSVFKEGYSRQTLLADVTSGVIVGIVALPLAIAFSIASGVKPEQGLYTAVIAGFMVSALGGSRVQIAGPTGAFIVIVYRIVHTYGYDGLAAATLVAGGLLIVMGLTRFGTLLKFVPYPLIVGFTSGIALIIFSSQIGDFLGLRIANPPADFIEKWAVYAGNLHFADAGAIGVGAGSLLIILAAQRFVPKIPGSLLALVVATAVVQIFEIPMETIGSRFGTVPTSFPSPRLPDVSWSMIKQVFSPAMTIAILGAIESLLSATVADGMIRSRHRSNTELIAQGAANILSPIFSGIPATGAIARTATNVKNGGRTPVAGIVHSIVLFLIMVGFGRWAELIPLPALAAILLVVAYNMSEWHSFVSIFRSPRSDVAVMLVTFLLTVIVDLTAAIQTGAILSAMLFIKRMAEVSHLTPLTKDLKDAEGKEDPEVPVGRLPDGVEVFELFGSLFFGAVDQFTETMRSLEKKPKIFILETRNLLSIDASGIKAMDDLVTQLQHQGTHFMLSGIHKQPLFALTQANLLERIGEENLCGDLEEALAKARAIVHGGTASAPLIRNA